MAAAEFYVENLDPASVVAVARRGAFGATGTRCRAILATPFGMSTEPLPRLGTGKIDRRSLKAQYAH